MAMLSCQGYKHFLRMSYFNFLSLHLQMTVVQWGGEFDICGILAVCLCGSLFVVPSTGGGGNENRNSVDLAPRTRPECQFREGAVAIPGVKSASTKVYNYVN